MPLGKGPDLAGALAEDDAVDLADYASDTAKSAADDGKPPLEIGWAVRDAVLEVFGADDDDDDDQEEADDGE